MQVTTGLLFRPDEQVWRLLRLQPQAGSFELDATDTPKEAKPGAEKPINLQEMAVWLL